GSPTGNIGISGRSRISCAPPSRSVWVLDGSAISLTENCLAVQRQYRGQWYFQKAAAHLVIRHNFTKQSLKDSCCSLSSAGSTEKTFIAELYSGRCSLVMVSSGFWLNSSANPTHNSGSISGRSHGDRN